MNLNNPKLVELKELIRNCDDEKFRHILWVSKEGDVNINKFTSSNPSHKFKIENPDLLFWMGVFNRGNNQVGEAAANDSKYIANLLKELLKYWVSKYNGHVEN